MTNVYLNATGKPLMVTLPDGGNIDLKAGEAIVGDYFERYTRTGSPPLMIPVTDMAMKRISKVHNPMVLDIKRDEPAPTLAAPEVVVVDLAEDVTATTPDEEPKAAEGGDDLFDGESREAWVTWLSENADVKVLVDMKAADLKDLATFLGVEQAGVGGTKLEVLAAIRNHLEE